MSNQVVSETEVMALFREAVQQVLRNRGDCVSETTTEESACSPVVVAAMNEDMKWLEQEQFRVILLNTKSEVLEIVTLYQGAIDRSVIRVAEVFKTAIRQNASSIICLHNHPSGDPSPSKEDMEITGKIKEAGELLAVPMLDHIIIGRHGYYSFKNHGDI